MLKRNLIFLFVTILFVVVAKVSLSFNANKEKKMSQNKMYMLSSQADKITGFIFNNGKEKLSLNFNADKGWLVKPLKQSSPAYPADMSLVKKIIQKLNSENFHKVDKSANGEKHYSIDVSVQGESLKTLEVLKQKAYDESVFIRSHGQTYVSEPFWQKLGQSFEFRQKEIFLLDYGLQKIEIQTNKQKFSYEYDKVNESWLPNSSSRKVIKDKQMVKFFQKMMRVKIFSFFTDSISTKNDRKYGLEQPMFKLNFVYENKPTWSIRLSQQDHYKYYGSIEHLKVYFQLTESAIDELKQSINFLN